MDSKLFLNKGEAAHYLHTLYDRFIEANGLDDIGPDFYSTINESLRSPITPSSRRRGNRNRYQPIDHIQTKSGRVLFLRTALDTWFKDSYIPVMLADLKTASLKIDKALGARYMIRAA